ncbi:MAG: UbiA prenyltransferase family protein [Candidatus Hodarchaeales archaeon]
MDTEDEKLSRGMKRKIKATIKLLRPQQYYKNVLVLFGLFFSRNLLRIDTWIPIILGFISLCLVSSLNYIINDFRDKEKDKEHPEKKNRPFASGDISTFEGLLMGLVLSVLTMLIIIIIPETLDPVYLPLPFPVDKSHEAAVVSIDSKIAFTLVLGALFLTSQFYSLFLKKYVFADVITISVNYVWRAVAGVVLISVTISPWLIILCFISAMLLALAKRKGDLVVLGTEAMKHKSVFKMYNMELIDQSISTIAAIELLAVFIYLNEKHANETVFIILSLPLFTFGIFRYLFLISGKNDIGRKAEKLFFDRQLLLTGFIIIVLFFCAIYFPNFLDNLIGLPPDVKI